MMMMMMNLMTTRSVISMAFAAFFAVMSVSGCATKEPVIEVDRSATDIDTQLDRLTNEMVRSLREERKTKIAIMEFPDLQGNVSELGRFIPEELTTRLFMTRRFEVVERQLLNQVLREQDLGSSGIIDAASAAEIGRMLGVDAIVSGTITDLTHAIRINARVIATETAGIFGVSSVTIEKEDHLAAMMGRGVGPNGRRPAAAPQDDRNQDQPRAISRDQPANGLPVVEDDDFIYRIASARKTGDNRVIVDVVITNTGHTDRELSVQRDTRFFDDMGQSYQCMSRTIGSNRSTWGGFSHLFISNVPTRLVIEFEEVDPKAKSISLLQMKMYMRGRANFDVNIRNIPLGME